MDYRLGISLAMVLIVFGTIIGISAITFRTAWSSAVSDINRQAVQMEAIGGGGASPEGTTTNPAIAENPRGGKP